MDSVKSMNDAIYYIEEHICEELDYKVIAKIALCSEHHFKRMFSFLAGISISEYVRRRRLTLAAIELMDNDLKVIDVAMKYGYSSADAFTRAFQVVHGVVPSKARDGDCQIVLYPKVTFQLSVRGVESMNYRIVEKDAFHIVGLKKRVPIVFNGVNAEIAAMYQLLTPEIIMEWKSISNVEPIGMISASTNFSEGRMSEEGELDHYIGVATTNVLDKYEVLNINAGTWAVFESIGPFPETLQDVWGRIYSEWFPSSTYESIDGPEIVWHESPDTTNPNYRSEIWIPIRKK